jgi:hypothetical protein
MSVFCRLAAVLMFDENLHSSESVNHAPLPARFAPVLPMNLKLDLWLAIVSLHCARIAANLDVAENRIKLHAHNIISKLAPPIGPRLRRSFRRRGGIGSFSTARANPTC